MWTAVRDAGDTGPTYPADSPTKRIDYVTASPNVTATHVEAIDSPASDHRAVLAGLEVWR